MKTVREAIRQAMGFEDETPQQKLSLRDCIITSIQQTNDKPIKGTKA